jgi:hypothetical protein
LGFRKTYRNEGRTDVGLLTLSVVDAESKLDLIFLRLIFPIESELSDFGSGIVTAPFYSGVFI